MGLIVPDRAGVDLEPLVVDLLVVGRATGRPLLGGGVAVRVGVLVGRLVDLLDERDDELELLELRVGLALRLDEELGDALRVGVELRVVEELDFRVEELLELPRLAELLVLLDPRRVAELPLLLLPRAL